LALEKPALRNGSGPAASTAAGVNGPSTAPRTLRQIASAALPASCW
jgi:hypothetical protein